MRQLAFATVAVIAIACSSKSTEKKSSSVPPAPPPTASADAAAPPTAKPPVPPATPAAATLPKQALVHGGTAWAVYLAIDAPGAASLTEAAARAKKLGYAVGPGEVSCTTPLGAGAPHAPANHHLIALYFATEAQARQVAAAYGTTLWIGQAKTYCMD